MHELGALEAQAQIHLQQERKNSPSVPVFPPSSVNSNRVHLYDLKTGGLIFSERMQPLSQFCLGTKHSGKHGNKCVFAAKFSESASVGVPKHKQSNRLPQVNSPAWFSSKKSQEQFLFKALHL